MSSAFVGGDVIELLALSRRLGSDGAEQRDEARRLAMITATVARDVATAAVLSPTAAARVAADVAGCEAGLAMLAAHSTAAGLVLARHGQALEAAALVSLVTGGLARVLTAGVLEQAAVNGAVTDIHSEEVAASLGVGMFGTSGNVRITEGIDGSGNKVWMVSRRQDALAGADSGASINGTGRRAQASAGVGVTLTWAFSSLEDARAAAALTTTVPTMAALGAPLMVAQHRIIRGRFLREGATAETDIGVSQEMTESGRAIEARATVGGALGGVLGSMLATALPDLPRTAGVTLRIEAPTSRHAARVVMKVDVANNLAGGTGITALDAGNRQVGRSTTTLTVDLTDPDAIAAARRLAEADLGNVKPEDLDAAVRIALHAGDMRDITVEHHDSVGLIQQSEAGAAVGIGGSASAAIEVWDRRP